MNTHTPDIIILFGPPASGKGTQAMKLNEALPEYVHFDFGSQLRFFVKEILGDYASIEPQKLEELKNIRNTDQMVDKALQCYDAMVAGQPVPSEILWEVVGQRIMDSVKNGKKLILEGIGRTYEDGYRVGKLAFDNGLSVGIFHLCITIEESIRRSKSRYYIPNSNKPYSSFEAAKADCKEGEEPWQRPEDLDEERIRGRYKKLYLDIFAKVLSTMQMESRGDLFIIDAQDSVEDNYKRIVKYLQTFYKQV
jgi:adenylate kinase family enzyme